MKKISIVAGFILVLATFGCATSSTLTATAVMEARSGSDVSGTVTFEEIFEGTVRVRLDLTGVPEGVHGFHVHEFGNCDSDDGSSAGGHFNPVRSPHAGPHDSMQHAGDMGNVVAGSDGTIKTSMKLTSFTLSPGVTSVAGLAVILHADRDDLTTQPTGNAGGRIACGIITLDQMK
jgi:Cu-Zn family superoxide dismutase